MFNFFRNKRDAPKQKRAIVWENWISGIEAESYGALSDNEEVRKCIHKIADLVSDMTIMLLKNGQYGDERVRDGLSRKIDIEPNKLMTRKQFIYKIVSDMIVYGNSIVFPKIKDGLIDDLEIFKMDSVVYQEKGNSYQILYKGNVYLPDEILHFVLIPDKNYCWRGQGFADQLVGAVNNLVQANGTKKEFLRSKWQPTIIMQVDSTAVELAEEENREKILNSYTDGMKRGRPWLVPFDEVKIQEIRPLTLNDLNVHESIKLEKQVIAGVFGIPAFLLGVGDFNREEYNNFIATTICSYGMIIQQELSKKLLYSPDLYFKFNPRSLMQYSLQEKTEMVQGLVKMGMLSRNEGRNEFDYSPSNEDGMNDYIVLENFIPVGDVGNQKKLEKGVEDDAE